MVVAVLMALQSAVGMLATSLYQDTEDWILAAWFGNDLVTLLVAVPLLVWSLSATKTGSKRAELVWYSMLGYSIYNYGYYLFGAALSWFFPLYVVLFSLGVITLILALSRLDVEAMAADFASSAPVRWIGGYMIFTGGGLTVAWIGQWATFMLTGSTPSLGQEGFRLVAAMDLSVMVPWFLIGAVLLLKRRPWGYVIGSIIIMKGATYTLVLTASSTVAAWRGIDGALGQIPIWGVWTVVGGAAVWGLLTSLDEPASETSDGTLVTSPVRSR